jgi:hypothetical protein
MSTDIDLINFSSICFFRYYSNTVRSHFAIVPLINTQSQIMLNDQKRKQIPNIRTVQFLFPVTASTDNPSCTLNHDFTENACYQKWKFIFSKSRNCIADWSMATSRFHAVVVFVTNNSDFYIRDRIVLSFILSRVCGSMTNNNVFWIGWLDLLTPSFTISLNHNQLQ